MAVIRKIWPNAPEPISVRPSEAADARRRWRRRPSPLLLGAPAPPRLPASRPPRIRPARLHPHNLQYAVTAWGKDPYALGSYSFTRRAPGDTHAKVHTE